MDSHEAYQQLLKSLQSQDGWELLDVINNLRNQGFTQNVSLPRIIICGYQSSGKGSVLEALSGVSFPNNDSLCSRFATEVILRPCTKKSASVRIIPAADTAPKLKEELTAFVKQHVGLDEIPKLVTEAKVKMGLTGDSTFSRNVLQLEISDPEMPHLTLVDLPGLIHRPNKDQTDGDVEVPKDLVRSYVQSPRSIVLAIVSANNDTSDQNVLKFAKEIDPHGSRTMGIVIEPDSQAEASPNESLFFALSNSFKLGWHVLRNGDHADKSDPSFNRDQVEERIFSPVPRKSIPKTKVGFKTLRTRLSKALLQQISNELPGVIKKIEHQLEDCSETLARIGPPRDTSAKQRIYLTTIAERFQSLVRAATAGDYHDPFFRIEDHTFGRRLRAELRHLTKSFAEDMEQRGHSYEIINSPSAMSKTRAPMKVRETLIRETQVLFNHSKGRELPGTYIPLLVGELFMKQSERWEEIADQHVHGAWKAVSLFLDYVLRHIADPTARGGILKDIVDPEMDMKLRSLKDKVKELMTPYQDGFPATLNRKFVVISNLVDCMTAYYQIALDVFVDNIASLAIENCLVKGLNDLLSPSRIAEMTDQDLGRLMSEPEDIQLVRDQMTSKKKALEAGLQVCKREERKMAAARLDVPLAPSTKNPQFKSLFSDLKSTSDAETLPFSGRTQAKGIFNSETIPPPETQKAGRASTSVDSSKPPKRLFQPTTSQSLFSPAAHSTFLEGVSGTSDSAASSSVDSSKPKPGLFAPKGNTPLFSPIAHSTFLEGVSGTSDSAASSRPNRINYGVLF
ncbi:hypothetical protein FQN54_000938 [Arachnomyces sp. PD_36]|nr:hypothetical protein FQN54_000938 [Arachnomyces sp. PD_36]